MSGSRSGKTSAMEYVWVAVLAILAVGVLSMGAALAWPTIESNWFPEPTPEPGYRDIRQIYTPTDEMIGCVDTVINIGPPGEQLYFYSAMAVAAEMNLIPGMDQKENYDDFTVAWIWGPEEGLKYAIGVAGAVVLEFVPLCSIPNEAGDGPGWVVFESVEVKTFDR